MRVLAELRRLLPPRDRLYAVGVLLMQFAGACFEAIGIGLILPFIALLSDPASVERYPFLGRAGTALGLSSHRQLLFASAVALALVYAGKSFFLGLTSYLQYRFVTSAQIRLGRRLLHCYLYAPYANHIGRNSAELLRNVLNDTSRIFQQAAVQVFAVLSEIMILLVVTAMLLWVDPVTTLFTLVGLGGAAYTFLKLSRRRAHHWGSEQQLQNLVMIKTLNEAFGGLKEVRLLGRERYFSDRYQASGVAYARATRAFLTLSELPRLFIETLGAWGMLVVLLITEWRGRALDQALPVMAVFAAAAIRLVPSLNRIVRGMTVIHYNMPSVEVVGADLRRLEGHVRLTEAPPAPTRPGERIGSIQLDGVSYAYPTSAEPVLRDVTLSIEEGESVAFVGPSGAGKTTLVDLLLGLLEPTEGRVVVGGRDVHLDLPAWRRRVGYVAQSVYLCDDSVGRNVALGLADAEIDDDRVWSALRAAQIDGFVAALPEGLATRVGERGVRLSGGQKQRLGIARALYTDPDVLVLDEATSSLDSSTEFEIARSLNQLRRRKTLIVIAHRLSTVKDCDRIFFLKDGRLANSASYDELVRSNRDFRAMARLPEA